ncbi:hypothetical protein P7C70_g2309, partial [Phenoliferia sp. Uapishka_3]
MSNSSQDVEKDFKAEEDPNVLVEAASINEDGLYGSTSASHRTLESYHVNFGGTIGTALFVYMGSGLLSGGPANLLLAYTWWTSVIFCIAECQKEIVTFWPTDAAFTRNASRYIDPAAGFAVGWNMYFNQAALVIFELVNFGVTIRYWEQAANINICVYIAILLVAWGVLNLWDTRFYGNSEFSFAIGKIILIVGLLIMTFITMLGGNPIHDRFGFRFWSTPGAFTTPYPDHPAGVGRFEGFLACVMNAAFTVAGPDYLSMIAGECRNPRVVMPKAFNNTVYRLCVFFIGSALAIGVLVPYDSAVLIAAFGAGLPGAARSPYVVAMRRLMIPVLPNIVNALILTSVFSAGNAFLFCGSRQLAQLSRDGHAPKLFATRNRNGVPYWAVSITLGFGAFAFLKASDSATIFITYITSLVGAAQLVNWIVMAWTWIAWNKGLSAQGLEHTKPVRSKLLPYGACELLGLGTRTFTVTDVLHFSVFLRGGWDTPDFFFAYTMLILFPILFVGWKIIKRTTYVTSMTMDLTSYINEPEFDEMAYVDPPRGKFSGYAHTFLKTLF